MPPITIMTSNNTTLETFLIIALQPFVHEMAPLVNNDSRVGFMLNTDYGNFSATRLPAVYRLGQSHTTALRRAWGLWSRFTMTADLSGHSGKSIVLVGLMGAGKTSVGRKLAEKMDLAFNDADVEIVEAAGCSIEDIFDHYGEEAFRDVEERVIFRLLEKGPQVLATGGGAFMNPKIRSRIAASGISVWLRADLDTLVRRTLRRADRPLLKNRNPKATLQKLIEERYPVYADADIVIDSMDEGPEITVNIISDALDAMKKPDSGGKGR